MSSSAFGALSHCESWIPRANSVPMSGVPSTFSNASNDLPSFRGATEPVSLKVAIFFSTSSVSGRVNWVLESVAIVVDMFVYRLLR